MLNQIINTEPWVEQAVCAQVDPDLWFPEQGGSPRKAIRVCNGCPVRDECLKYALDNDELHGVWGGYNERERRRMKLGLPARIPAKPGLKHGVAGYKRGCKCSTCRGEWAAYQREYMRSRRPLRQCRGCGDQITGRGNRKHCDNCRAGSAA